MTDDNIETVDLLAERDCPGLEKCEREDCRKSEQCLGGSVADYARWAGA